MRINSLVSWLATETRTVISARASLDAQLLGMLAWQLAEGADHAGQAQERQQARSLVGADMSCEFGLKFLPDCHRCGVSVAHIAQLVVDTLGVLPAHLQYRFLTFQPVSTYV